MRFVSHAAVVAAALSSALACKPAAPPQAPAVDEPGEPGEPGEPAAETTSGFDPAAVSDAPLSAPECARFGKMRAEDPMEPGTADEYARECEEFTGDEDPWMRRVSRCMIDAPDDAARARCMDEGEPDR